MVNVLSEIEFKTARAGGKGGQNVNKVETMVEGSFHVERSEILTDRQKKVILENIGKKLTREGYLRIRSQKHRSQLENKEDVIVRMHVILANAMIRRKKRKATKPTQASKLKRLKHKKQKSAIKKERRKVEPDSGE